MPHEFEVFTKRTGLLSSRRFTTRSKPSAMSHFTADPAGNLSTFDQNSKLYSPRGCVRYTHHHISRRPLGRPDRRTLVGKGGRPMANTSLPSIRKELQECFRHCERLLASALMSDNPPFSQEELAMMMYYADEIAKISVSQDKISVAQDMKSRVSAKLASESNGKSGMTTGGHEIGSQEWSSQQQWEHHGWGWWNVGKR